MDFLNFFNRANSEYIEQLYSQYQKDPESVEETWRVFFAGFEIGLGRPLVGGGGTGEFATLSQRRSDGTGDLVHSYRELGHLVAALDPLGNNRPSQPLLDIKEFGYSDTDLDRQVGSGGFLGATDGTLKDLVEKLKTTYCGTLGVEYMDIPDKEQRAWLQERMEPLYNQPKFSAEESKRILKLLIAAEEFEQFLHTKYIGQKRFSLQGGDALIPMLDTLIEEGATLGLQEAVTGMAHRGRLNVLAHIMQKPYEYTFSEFEGTIPQEANQGDGDVKYHKGFSNDRTTLSGNKVHLSLSPNPSHLELVDPVVEGVVRAKQQYLGDTDHVSVLPILIHGEAAFAGQGIVPETLNLSELAYYRTGGTIHIIINNQLGFTATANQTRFTPYATDVAKMIKAPIFHVNADDPEAVVHAARLAIGFRQQFRVDVMIDLWCYRRYGHNETDDPTFTQPLMYERIALQKPVCELYAQKLISEDRISPDEVEALKSEIRQTMETALGIAREKLPHEIPYSFGGAWKGMTRAGDDWDAKTAVSSSVIKTITDKTTIVADSFHIHRKLKKQYEIRREMGEGKRPADWGCAEMWAVGSLLLEGTPVRMTGQDVERGTFSHRHAVLHDTENGELYVPLENLAPKQAKFNIVNTMLSELAVLGFEYGFSSADPRNLVVWEAQFGDFVNGAQPIIDQFISSSESKWAKMSGLVMLLPHGYEGQGPEHSSARLERFLQLCGENNIQVCYPTLPAQYFHLLRRQILRPFRKPLIVMTPKSLLRDERSTSPLSEFTEMGFRPVIDDPSEPSPEGVKRILFCTGKVFFNLQAKRDQQKRTDVAIIRLEQLYPVPRPAISAVLEKYRGANELLWVQEEPRNMGAWTFIDAKLGPLASDRILEYRGRKESASPAVGSFRWHQREEEDFVRLAFEPLAASVGSDKNSAKK